MYNFDSFNILVILHKGVISVGTHITMTDKIFKMQLSFLSCVSVWWTEKHHKSYHDFRLGFRTHAFLQALQVWPELLIK